MDGFVRREGKDQRTGEKEMSRGQSSVGPNSLFHRIVGLSRGLNLVAHSALIKAVSEIAQ